MSKVFSHDSVHAHSVSESGELFVLIAVSEKTLLEPSWLSGLWGLVPFQIAPADRPANCRIVLRKRNDGRRCRPTLPF